MGALKMIKVSWGSEKLKVDRGPGYYEGKLVNCGNEKWHDLGFHESILSARIDMLYRSQEAGYDLSMFEFSIRQKV